MVREVWIQIIAFPADHRTIREIGRAISSFGKLQVCDRVNSSDTEVLVKVKVDELKDIPISIVIRGTKHYIGESWTCPVVIPHDNLQREEPADEDPVPEDGNPHPKIKEEHSQPNQNKFVVGPFPAHYLVNQQNVQPNQHQHNQQDNLDEEELEVDEDFPGWGHLAMP